MSLGPLYVLLGEMSVQGHCPILIGLFVFLEWSPVSSLYILEIRPLSEVSCFPYCWFSLDFRAVFFSHAEAFYFDEIPFVYSSLYIPSCRVISVKILLCGISEIFLPMFSSRTLMVP